MNSPNPTSGVRPGFLVAVVLGLGVMGVILWRSGPRPEPAVVPSAEVVESAAPAGGGASTSSRIMARLSGADVSLLAPRITPGPVSEELSGTQVWWEEQRISPELQGVARGALDRAMNDLFRFGVVRGVNPSGGAGAGAPVPGDGQPVTVAAGRGVEGQPVGVVTDGVHAYRESDRIRNNLVKELQQVRREAILRARQGEAAKAAAGAQ